MSINGDSPTEILSSAKVTHTAACMLAGAALFLLDLAAAGFRISARGRAQAMAHVRRLATRGRLCAALLFALSLPLWALVMAQTAVGRAPQRVCPQCRLFTRKCQVALLS